MAKLTGARMSKNYRFTVKTLSDRRYRELVRLVRARNERNDDYKLRVNNVKRINGERDVYVHYR
jgi:predicted patatin/cPLA2 family phospholipase